MRCAAAVTVLWIASFSQNVDVGTYELGLEGEMSVHESGAARFEGNKKVDGDRVFVVHLRTPALEGGVFLLFHGSEPPTPGQYALVPAEIKGMDGYQKIELDDGEVAVLYYEMERNHMILLGSTGTGVVEVLAGGEDDVRGTLEVEVKGAAGNPNALLGVRPKRATMKGEFDATPGKVDFRKP